MDIIKKFLSEYNEIEQYYEFLVQKTKRHEFVGIVNEWLIDNFYILVEHKNSIIKEKKNLRKNNKLYLKLYPEINNIVVLNNFNINFKILCNELKKYQKDNDMYFTYKELKNMKDVLLFIYINRLSILCKEERKKIVDQDEIVRIINSHKNKELELKDFINDSEIEKNYNYLFELNSKLKELGSKSNKLFKEFNEVLEEKNISLKEIINDEFQNKMNNNILVSNIFNDLREFTEFNSEDLFEKVSPTEK
ncbi:MAG: hypothetical protein IIZ67_05635, partial [Bacilli bacterium]|nr:hypothetical protein [Bacilli bacterium]